MAANSNAAGARPGPARDISSILGPGGPGRPMTPGKIERAKNRKGVLLRLWGYLQKQRAALIATVFIVVAVSGLNLLGPYLLGRAIDDLISKRDLPGLVRISVLMITVYAAVSLLTYVQSYVMAGASQKTVRDLRADLFDHLQKLGLPYFDKRPHGELMSRLTNDVENVSQVLSDSVTQLVSGLLGMVGGALAMFLLNPRLALVTVATVAASTVVLNKIVSTQSRAAFRAQQANLGTLNGLIEETITGQRVVKAYHREAVVLAEFDAASNALRQSSTRAQIVSGVVGPLMNGVNNLGLAVVAGVGGTLVIQHAATVGTIAGFVSYARLFGRPLNDIANLYNSIQSALAGAERIFEVMDEPVETDAQTQTRQPIVGDVVFEAVDFSYVPGQPILKNISLHAKPGQTVALVGPTGAGKTTIINLLTRFYAIDSGAIRIDGTDIDRFSKTDLRRQLGIVLQDTFLFSATVKDNIRYGRADATDEEIREAARLANAHTFIERLPQGYDTPLSERAGNLSQGQRQLLAIARAILANPRILILDEATSSVDTRTEQNIQDALLRLMEGRTSFVIAHRLSTIREANQILVLVGGEIVERGTHSELLAQKGFYYGLYATHFETETQTAPVQEPQEPEMLLAAQAMRG